ncbi:unnamed protein product [Tuber melanosporum]|uniref:(Perigord truffle) hypothetical protein n=1 Tax=Tuber melanosporum (strain Mel28) TaxID=656061 RepID=D5G699_TUBMM|nr:uncharacterized protein GSTUM_00001671001 [Tuber melanosporum]CAZ80042.1 unnamed protein product [Tuber melanosporum]
MAPEASETGSPLLSPEHSPPFHTPLMESASDPMDLGAIPLQPLDQEDEAPLTSSDLSSSPPLPPNANYANYTSGSPWADKPVVPILEPVDAYLASNRAEYLDKDPNEKAKASSEAPDEEGDEEDEEDLLLETGQDGSSNTRGEGDKRGRRETNEAPPPKGKRKRRNNAESKETREPGQPILLTTSITTTYAKDLYELCQSHVRLVPLFTFEQNKPQEFTVVLKLVGPLESKEIVVDGIFPSKRHAKEAAAALGIEYVRDLPKDGSSRLFTMDQEPENWVGLLSDMCNGKQIRPQYTDYATPGAGYSCEIRLGAEFGFPGVECMVFGDKHRAFKNKKSAKIAAAKEAILWIREQAPPGTPVNGRTPRAAASGPEGVVDIPEGTPTAQIVNLICPKLGFTSPEYIFHADPHAPGLYDVDAVIKRPKGPRPAKIGPIRSVFGKKKARDEIATCVLRWLRKEAEKQGLKIVEHDEVNGAREDYSSS